MRINTLLTVLLFVIAYLTAYSNTECVSILDVDVLTKDQKGEIRSAISTLQANRKVNGQSICFTIDFLDKMPEADKGFTKDGRRILKQNYYMNWVLSTNSTPAVLMLFVKDTESDNYRLESFLMNDLLQERIPELVSKYIRDKVVGQKTSYFDMINASITALGRALDDTYKLRLINDVKNQLTNPVPTELQPGYANYDFNYLYFESTREEYPLSYVSTGGYTSVGLMDGNGVLTTASANTKNIYDDFGELKTFGIVNGEPLKVNDLSITDGTSLFDFDFYELDCGSSSQGGNYYVKKLHENYFLDQGNGVKDIGSFIEGFNLDAYYANVAKTRANTIKNECHHFDNILKIPGMRSSTMLFYDYNRSYHTRVKVGYGEVKKGEDITSLQGQLMFSDFTDNQPTWCNAFAIRASKIIFGSSPISGTTANMEPDMTADEGNFVNLTGIWESGENNNEIWNYINKGFIVYFVNASDHIEIGYDIDADGNFRTIGGGGWVDIKKTNGFSFMEDEKSNGQKRGVSVFLYLGHLKI